MSHVFQGKHILQSRHFDNTSTMITYPTHMCITQHMFLNI